MQTQLTEAQRLSAILILEGMPPELPLLVDSPNYEHLSEETEHDSEHRDVQAALSLDEATPVDTFMSEQAPQEYRWKNDRDENKEAP